MKPEIHDDEVMQRIRGLVGVLLREDVSPIVIAYGLTYVAVEFGLQAEPDARRVLSTLLGATATATQDSVPLELDDNTEGFRLPGGAIKQ